MSGNYEIAPMSEEIRQISEYKNVFCVNFAGENETYWVKEQDITDHSGNDSINMHQEYAVKWKTRKFSAVVVKIVGPEEPVEKESEQNEEMQVPLPAQKPPKRKGFLKSKAAQKADKVKRKYRRSKTPTAHSTFGIRQTPLPPPIQQVSSPVYEPQIDNFGSGYLNLDDEQQTGVAKEHSTRPVTVGDLEEFGQKLMACIGGVTEQIETMHRQWMNKFQAQNERLLKVETKLNEVSQVACRGTNLIQHVKNTTDQMSTVIKRRVPETTTMPAATPERPNLAMVTPTIDTDVPAIVLHAINRPLDPTDHTQVIIGGCPNIKLKCGQYDKAYSRPSARHILLLLLEFLFVEDGKCVLGDYSYRGKDNKKALNTSPMFQAALADVKRKFPDYNINPKEIESISTKCLNCRKAANNAI